MITGQGVGEMHDNRTRDEGECMITGQEMVGNP